MSGGGKRKRRLLSPTAHGPSGWRLRQGEKREGIGEARPRRALVKNTTGRWETENVTSVCLFNVRGAACNIWPNTRPAKPGFVFQIGMFLISNLVETSAPHADRLVKCEHYIELGVVEMIFVSEVSHILLKTAFRFENPNMSPPSGHPSSGWNKGWRWKAHVVTT